MKKLLFSLLTISWSMLALADGQNAQISSTPTPAISNKPLEVTITTNNIGSEVYCYTWCHKVNGAEKKPVWGWDDVHTDKFKMTGGNGTYKLTITNIQEFYGLTDAELAGLTELGFIAKTRGEQQTQDLFLAVEQGRRDVYSGGEGTASDPFILKTASDLQSFASTPGDWASGTYVMLESDIDASSLASAIGSSSSPFCGVFDGNGYSIKNLTLLGNTLGVPTGLFGVISEGEVRNLGVVSANVSGANSVGILAGELRSGTIERCFTSGSVSGTSICIGGLVGENLSGSILDCYSGANVENASDYATGGLVGKNRGTIANTYSAGSVSGFDYVGGLVGANYGTVKNSVALNSTITSYNDFAARFGGNNNSRNATEQTYSWEDIVAGHNSWTSHGDHSITHPASTFRNQDQFKALTGWNFSTVWEWRKEGEKEYPALRNIKNQVALLSDAYFSSQTSVEEISLSAGNGAFRVGPNPTYGELHLSAPDGILSYEIYNLGGGVISRGEPNGTTEVTIDLGAAPSGFYILRAVTAEGGENIHKIIKK